MSGFAFPPPPPPPPRTAPASENDRGGFRGHGRGRAGFQSRGRGNDSRGRGQGPRPFVQNHQSRPNGHGTHASQVDAGGPKRKWDAFNKPSSSHNHGPIVAPAVPSFGAPLPRSIPSPASATKPNGASNPALEVTAKAKSNQLGLTPYSDSSGGEDEDEDDEAAMAAASSNPLVSRSILGVI